MSSIMVCLDLICVATLDIMEYFLIIGLAQTNTGICVVQVRNCKNLGLDFKDFQGCGGIFSKLGTMGV